MTTSAARDLSPLLALFRREIKRRWSTRSLLLVALAVVALVALNSAWLDFWSRIGLSIGLVSPAGAPVELPNPSLWPTSEWPLPGGEGRLATSLLSAPILAACYLMPAFAGQSIAELREKGRLEDLQLAGYSPAQILLACGGATAAPFVLLAALGGAMATAAADVFPGHTVTVDAPGGTPLGPPVGIAELWQPHLEIFASVVLHAALLVTLSALCRRTRTAIVVCYVVELLVLPLALVPLTLAIHAAGSQPDPENVLHAAEGMARLAPGFCLAILLPRALKNLYG